MKISVLLAAALSGGALATPVFPRDNQAQAAHQVDQTQAANQAGQAQAGQQVHGAQQGDQAQAAHQGDQSQQNGQFYYPGGYPRPFNRPYYNRPYYNRQPWINRPYNPNDWIPGSYDYLNRYRNTFGNYPTWNDPTNGQGTWDPRGVRYTGGAYYRYDDDGNVVGVA